MCSLYTVETTQRLTYLEHRPFRAKTKSERQIQASDLKSSVAVTFVFIRSPREHKNVWLSIACSFKPFQIHHSPSDPVGSKVSITQLFPHLTDEGLKLTEPHSHDVLVTKLTWGEPGVEQQPPDWWCHAFPAPALPHHRTLPLFEPLCNFVLLFSHFCNLSPLPDNKWLGENSL